MSKSIKKYYKSWLISHRKAGGNFYSSHMDACWWYEMYVVIIVCIHFINAHATIGITVDTSIQDQNKHIFLEDDIINCPDYKGANFFLENFLQTQIFCLLYLRITITSIIYYRCFLWFYRFLWFSLVLLDSRWSSHLRKLMDGNRGSNQASFSTL